MNKILLSVLIVATALLLFVSAIWVVDARYRDRLDSEKEDYLCSMSELIQKMPGLSHLEENLSLDRKRLVEVRYSTVFMDKAIGYNGIKNVPWDQWSIQEKMYLCAYGSSGNKLNKEDMKEIQRVYANNP